MLFLPAALAAPAITAVSAQLALPDLLQTTRISGTLFFCGEEVPLKDENVRERFDRERLLSTWHRSQIVLWLKRAGRYLPYIEKQLKKRNLPDDLKYLAVLESDLQPHAGSHKGAVGFWQFMPATARRYGLRVNRDFDDRRNIYKSTRAALDYLQDLHLKFGSWALAAAGYNMGETGLQKAILRQKVTDYYRLYLPLETQRYLLRAVTIKMIMTHPSAYGFNLKPGDAYQPIATDVVSFRLTRSSPILAVAEAARTDFKAIKDLNPELRGYDLPAGQHDLMVPKGRGKGFNATLKKMLNNISQKKTSRRTYIVKKGDSLTAIAKKFKVSLPALLLWNKKRPNQPIHPGEKLIVSSGN